MRNSWWAVNITLKFNYHYTSTDRSDHPQSGRRRDSRGEPGVINETRRFYETAIACNYILNTTQLEARESEASDPNTAQLGLALARLFLNIDIKLSEK